jgi:hypothetical protein
VTIIPGRIDDIIARVSSITGDVVPSALTICLDGQADGLFLDWCCDDRVPAFENFLITFVFVQRLFSQSCTLPMKLGDLSRLPVGWRLENVNGLAKP